MKYIDSEKLIAEIERLRNECAKSIGDGFIDGDLPKTMTSGGAAWVCEQLLSFITSLQQEQPKFKVGDLVVSKKNPHLTYRILATNIPNELGKTDYKVEIFTDGKQGLLSEPHNIHLISSDKIEDWGELVQQEQPEVDLEKEIQSFWNANALEYRLGHIADINFLTYTARHFYELGKNARKEE